MRCANTLATSAFLASTVSTHSLQQAALPTSHTLLTYSDSIRVETAWNLPFNTPALEPALQHIQKAWDAPIVSNLSELDFASATSEIDLARLKAASSPHSGDWLHAPPIASIGQLLSDEYIRLAGHSHSESRHVHPTHAYVANPWMPEAFTACPA